MDLFLEGQRSQDPGQVVHNGGLQQLAQPLACRHPVSLARSALAHHLANPTSLINLSEVSSFFILIMCLYLRAQDYYLFA